MLDVVLAISTAFMYAVGVVLIARGISRSNFFSSVIVVTLIGNIVFWPILIILGPKTQISSYGLMLFALAGLLHPGVARLLYQIGILEVGLPVNSSIFATNSIFGTLFAILLLDETPTIGLWTGIVCVVIGVSTIQGSMDTTAFRSRKLVKHGLLVPLIASVFAGLGYALKKVALNVYNEPLIGVTVAYSADLVFYAIVFVLSPRIRDAAPINSHTSRLFWKGGFFIALGTFLGFYAIKSGNVAVVMPLLQIEPLFVLFITYLFLRKVETLSKKLVFGTLIIVTGVILVTAFRG